MRDYSQAETKRHDPAFEGNAIDVYPVLGIT